MYVTVVVAEVAGLSLLVVRLIRDAGKWCEVGRVVVVIEFTSC